MYFPVAAAMLLLPWSHMDYSEGNNMRLLPYHALGAALFNSVVATGLTQLGAGTAMVFAMWGAAGVLVALCLTQVRGAAQHASASLISLLAPPLSVSHTCTSHGWQSAIVGN